MPIPVTTVVSALFTNFEPRRTKLHLAQWNQREAPLDVFYAGEFGEWQSDQSRRNFRREFVFALIETPRRDIWLFAGLWQRTGEPEWQEDTWASRRGLPSRPHWVYPLQVVSEAEALAGRLHVHFEKRSRMPYRLMETCCDRMTVSSLVEQPQTFPRFMGFRDVALTMPQLRAMYAASPEDWQTALSSVGGVYIITNAAGEHYVGSASGREGFWIRWRSYAETGHGGNRLLKQRLGTDPVNASRNFGFAILETADSSATREEVIQREAHWKRVLGSRAFGLNLN